MDEKPWNGYRQMEFKRALNVTLADTNWRAMCVDASYTLGLLKGRIRGVSSEEDLKKMARIRLKKARKN